MDLVVSLPIHFHPKIPYLYCDSTLRLVHRRSQRNFSLSLDRILRTTQNHFHNHFPLRFRAMYSDGFVCNFDHLWMAVDDVAVAAVVALVDADVVAANFVESVALAEEELANATDHRHPLDDHDDKFAATLPPDSFVLSY